MSRFREEGKLLSRLCKSHLSVVQVYDFGVLGAGAAAVPFLVLEWLEGMELGEVLQRRGRAYRETEAIELLRPAMEAIGVAHGMRIAHRDLKPANLYVMSGGGRLKVLDFGIAKAMPEGETATQRATQTQSGFSSFSTGYGAPEQFQSKKYGPTGPWTDVHALGLILVEMVTGRPPLDGDAAHAPHAAARISCAPRQFDYSEGLLRLAGTG